MNYWWTEINWDEPLMNYWCQVCSWPILALGPLEHRLLRWAGTCPGAALWLEESYHTATNLIQFVIFPSELQYATGCYRMLQGPFVPSKPWSLYARREVLELVGTSIFVLLWAVPRKLSSRKSLIALVEAQQLFWFVLFLGEPSIFHILHRLCDWECLDISKAAFMSWMKCQDSVTWICSKLTGDDWCNL